MAIIHTAITVGIRITEPTTTTGLRTTGLIVTIAIIIITATKADALVKGLGSWLGVIPSQLFLSEPFLAPFTKEFL
jgi:hypothetical protein